VTNRAIVIFPTAALDAIEALRSRYDSLATFIPAHITLVFPFESTIPSDGLRRHVESVAASAPPFPVVLGGFSGDGAEYLFLNVQTGNDEIVSLHDRLYSGMLAPYLSSQHTFAPHLTVGRGFADAQELANALADASRFTQSIVGSVDELAVFDLDAGRIEFVVDLGR
jgi:2'-5' RNA ligase